MGKIKLPANSISPEEVAQPTYRKLADQNNDSYELMTQKDLMIANRNNAEIIVKIGNETAYHSHTIQPIVMELNKAGDKVNKKRSQSLGDYENYRKFLIDRLKKGHLYKLKVKVS